MRRTDFLHRVTLLIGCLFLVGLMLTGGEISSAVLAQALPPRPTLTPEPQTAPPGHHGNNKKDGNDQATNSPTPVATATLTPTPVPPPPMRLPVTGGSAGDGGVWIALGLGLMVSGAGVSRALQLLGRKRRKEEDREWGS